MERVVVIGIGMGYAQELLEITKIAAEHASRKQQLVIVAGRGSKSLAAKVILEHYLIHGDIHFPDYPKGSPFAEHRPPELVLDFRINEPADEFFIPEIPKQNFNKFGKPKHQSGSTFHR